MEREILSPDFQTSFFSEIKKSEIEPSVLMAGEISFRCNGNSNHPTG